MTMYRFTLSGFISQGPNHRKDSSPNELVLDLFSLRKVIAFTDIMSIWHITEENACKTPRKEKQNTDEIDEFSI